MTPKATKDELIASAIRNTPQKEMPISVRRRLLALMSRPRYNFWHLLLVVALLTMSPLALSALLKLGILSPFIQVFLFSLFGLLGLSTATIISSLIIIRRETIHTNYGKKINSLIDTMSDS